MEHSSISNYENMDNRQCLDSFIPRKYPDKKDIKVATMTLCCKINCNIDVAKVIKYHQLDSGKVEKIKSGSNKKKDVAEVKIRPDDITKKARKNKKKKNNFYNQVTIVIKPFPTRKNGVNMKLSDNGSIQMTGATSIEEGHLTIRKMLEFLFEWNNEIFYRKEETSISVKSIDSTSISVSEESKETLIILSKDDISNVAITSTDCELIIISFALPFYINLKKLNDIFKNKYKLLSIFGTSSYPGVNTKFTYNRNCNHTEHIKKKKKYMCDCRDMSIFTFRTGKVIITGFDNLEKIQTIFDKYIKIIKDEEENIRVEPPILINTTINSLKKYAPNNKIMKMNDKVFEIVDSF